MDIWYFLGYIYSLHPIPLCQLISACLRFVSSVCFIWVSALPWCSPAYVFLIGFFDVGFFMPSVDAAGGRAWLSAHLGFWVRFTSDYWLPMCKVIRYHSRPLCRVKVVCFEDNIFSFIGPSFSAYKVVCVLLLCRRFLFASTFFNISHVVAVALSNRDFPPEGVGSGGWTTAASA